MKKMKLSLASIIIKRNYYKNKKEAVIDLLKIHLISTKTAWGSTAQFRCAAPP